MGWNFIFIVDNGNNEPFTEGDLLITLHKRGLFGWSRIGQTEAEPREENKAVFAFDGKLSVGELWYPPTGPGDLDRCLSQSVGAGACYNFQIVHTPTNATWEENLVIGTYGTYIYYLWQEELHIRDTSIEGPALREKLIESWVISPPPTPVEPTEPPYLCPYCSATFWTLEELNAHIEATHPEAEPPGPPEPPEPSVCSERDVKCVGADRYMCINGKWSLIERNSPDCQTAQEWVKGNWYLPVGVGIILLGLLLPRGRKK